MMTSVPTLHAGNLTWPHGTDKGEEALDYMEGLSASSVLPPESFLDLQSTRGPVAVSHPFPEGGWVVGVGVEQAWLDILVLVLKGLVMSAVIVASVLGNLLVIVSVARYHKLRVITNYFVVSMALADMLVALMAMVFNASVQLTHTWLFGQLMCDLWNSMDVYFSTVSILHLCCISIDRYTAIVQPLDYPLRMTVRTVSLMLAVAWLSPVFISVVPIFLGWYTTQEHLDRLASTPGLCEFRVNVAYAVVSSSVSFWIPGVIMLVMYFKIYREADRQEMMVFRSTVAALLLNKHLHINGMTRSSVKITDDAPSTTSAGGGGCSKDQKKAPGPSDGEAVGSAGVHHNGMPAFESACPGNLEQHLPPPPSVVARVDLPQSDESTPTPTPSPGSTPISRRGRAGVKRRFLGVGVRKSSTGVGPDGIVNVAAPEVKKKQASLHKMKRERKAAKTLGIIVSVFLLCWLPFFSWYIVSALCGDACAVPEWLVTVLFWIGYFNSTLNPIIYAYFNRDFRKAFRKTLSHYGLDCAVCRRCIPRIRCCGKGCRRKGLARCVGFGAGQDTPSSEIQPRSALSSEYCHIEMTTIDKVAKIGVDH